MIRTQVQLTEEQMRRLRAAARARRVSIAELVRRCIDRALEEEGAPTAALYDRAAEVVGSFADAEATDLSVRHDDYLAGAYD